MAEEETTILHPLLELLIIVALIDMSITEGASLLEDIILDVVKQILHVIDYALERNGLLLQSIAAHYFYSAVFKVTTTHHEAYWHTLELIVSKLEAWALIVGVIKLYADAELAETVDDWLHCLRDSSYLVSLANRDDYNLDRSETSQQSAPCCNQSFFFWGI